MIWKTIDLFFKRGVPVLIVGIWLAAIARAFSHGFDFGMTFVAIMLSGWLFVVNVKEVLSWMKPPKE